MSSEQNAAIKIQSLYKGWKTRKKSILNHVEYPEEFTSYGVRVTGNETFIDILHDKKRDNGKFTFVGCSGLKSLWWIVKLIDWDKYEYSADGYTNIPKLFILDNSNETIAYWKELKSLFIQSSNSDNFNNLLNSKMTSNPNEYYYPQTLEMIGTLSIFGVTIGAIYYNNPHIEKEKLFQFLKNTVIKATLIQGMWENLEHFKYIKQSTNIPTYVYASNIIEYVYIEENTKLDSIKNITKNICSLSPIVTIHTRTSNETITNIGKLIPKTTLFIDSNNHKQHYDLISNQYNYTDILFSFKAIKKRIKPSGDTKSESQNKEPKKFKK